MSVRRRRNNFSIRNLVNFWNHITRVSSTPLYKYLAYLPSYLRGGNGNCRLPGVVLLAVNSRCNLHCKMCDVGRENAKDTTFYKTSVPEGAPQLSLEKLKDIIDQLAEFRPFLAVNSLEPFLYKDLLSRVYTVYDWGIII